jgi:chromosome segregation ATPase
MMASQVDQLQVSLSHADSEIKTQRIALQRTIEEYELVFAKLGKERQEMEKDLQILYQTHEQEKMKHFSERDGWAVEADRLRSLLQEKSFTAAELGRQVGDLNEQLKMSELQVRKLTDYNRQIEATFQQRERDAGEALRRQQEGLDLLRL